MKRHITVLLCMLTAATGAFAQNIVQPGNAGEITRLREQLSTAQTQLQNERAARRRAEQSLTETRGLLETQGNVQDQIERAQAARDSIETIYREQSGVLARIREKYPLIITRIELGNSAGDDSMIDDFGSTLRRSRMRLLTPRFQYTSLLEQPASLTFEVRIYNMASGLKQVFSSSNASSYLDDDVEVETGNGEIRLAGWGNETRTSFPTGQYRVEIWHKDVCLGQKEFSIL